MYDFTFDYKKPSVQIVGKWQPWHEGHTALFKKALTITGQVVIMVREVYGSEEDAPFGEIAVIDTIKKALEAEGFYDGQHYIIICTPNIVGLCNGPGDNVRVIRHDYGQPEENIRSSNIRSQLREEGKL